MNNDLFTQKPVSPHGSIVSTGKQIPLSEETRTALLNKELDDLGNAECMAMVFQHELRFSPALGWLWYNGRYWESDREDQALLSAGRTIRLRQKVYASMSGQNDKGAIDAAKKLEQSANRHVLYGALVLAQALLRAEEKWFDASPYQLNTLNGIVDLQTGALLPHNHEAGMTHCTGIEYHPDAQSDLWERTIHGIADGNKELVKYFQLIAGYACTGDVSAQRFFYFYGEGANGKSLITDLWGEALGGVDATGYAVRLQSETVMGSKERTAGSVSPDILSLRGKRLALFSEPDGDIPINPQRLKDLTGGDSLNARAPFQAPITFRPMHTLIGCGNHMPHINDSGHAIARRMALVPFTKTFEPSRLPDELRSAEHIQAILAWMVRGAIMLHENGWFTPSVVTEASKEYLDETDLIRQWIAERCIIAESETSSRNLYIDFDAWRLERRERAISILMFSRRMKKLGFHKRKSNGDSLFIGLVLRPEPFESQSSVDSDQPRLEPQ